MLQPLHFEHEPLNIVRHNYDAILYIHFLEDHANTDPLLSTHLFYALACLPTVLCRGLLQIFGGPPAIWPSPSNKKQKQKNVTPAKCSSDDSSPTPCRRLSLCSPLSFAQWFYSNLWLAIDSTIAFPAKGSLPPCRIPSQSRSGHLLYQSILRFYDSLCIYNHGIRPTVFYHSHPWNSIESCTSLPTYDLRSVMPNGFVSFPTIEFH